MTCAEYSEYILFLSKFGIQIFNFYISFNLLKRSPGPCDVKKSTGIINTTSRQEHQWFIMWQCASETAILQYKISTQMTKVIPVLLFFITNPQKITLSLCPSRFRFRTSPYCLMVVLLPSWGKNKRRALGLCNSLDVPWPITLKICNLN